MQEADPEIQTSPCSSPYRLISMDPIQPLFSFGPYLPQLRRVPSFDRRILSPISQEVMVRPLGFVLFPLQDKPLSILLHLER